MKISRFAVLLCFLLGLLARSPRSPVYASSGARTMAPAAGDPLVLVAAGGTRLYVVRPGAQAMLLTGRDGRVLATQRLDATPTALALDAGRHRLYVALDGEGVAVLDSATLRPMLALPSNATISAMSPINGRDALYVADAATGRILYLTYTPHGSVRMTPVDAAASQGARLRILLKGRVAAFWAAGFKPGEAVAFSLGAKNEGTLRADPSGLVRGALHMEPQSHGKHKGIHAPSLGLYGLSSDVSLVGIVAPPAPPHPHAARSLPPLYLGMLPGPSVTLTSPIKRLAARVPASAASILALPLLLLLVLIRRRRARKRAQKQQELARKRPKKAAPRVRVA